MSFGPTTTNTALPWQLITSKTSSDKLLIERIAGGEQLAMSTLFSRHKTHLHRFLVRIVRDQNLAEDLVSDVFLDVWRQAEHFAARSSVSTWLHAIGRLKAFSVLRRRRTHAEQNDEGTTAIADRGDNPETVLEKKNSAEVLRLCVDSLSPIHRQVIDLVYYHEKSVSEVMKIVGIPLATVKTRMFYARKQLATLVMAA